MKKRTIKNIKSFFVYFLFMNSALIFCVLTIRVIEYSHLISELQHIQWPIKSFFYSVSYDLIFLAKLSLFLIPIGFSLSFIHKKVSASFLWIVGGLFLLLFIFLTQFFHSAEVLLDKTIFYFSLNELLIISGGESSGLIGRFLWLYIIPILVFSVFVVLQKKIIQKKLVLLFSSVLTVYCFILMFFLGISNPPAKVKYTSYETQLHTSKANYFMESVFTLFFKKNSDFKDYMEKRARYIELTGHTPKNKHFKYPFLKNPEVLSNQNWAEYIDLNDSTNLVILFAEGLSKSFVNSDGVFGNLMPFFDSLSQQGLYWPNMLSITDRTHGIFSSSLASLPHGFERGFLNYNSNDKINYTSLPRLFKNKGYQLNFFYGGWSYFDNYRSFLEANNFNNFIDLEFIDSVLNWEKSAAENEFGWGYHDKTVYKSYFAFADKYKDSSPYFDLILSLSLHSPFSPPDEEMFLEKASTLKGVDDRVINAVPDVVSTILYTDESLRYFFDTYKKRKDFDNTVFLIYGDHNVHSLGVVDDLDSYHVPFLIYSSRLLKRKTFKEIISHWDVPATVVGLFPGISLGENPIHWLGNGVEFKEETKANNPIFLGTFKGDVIGVVLDKNAYLNGQLYKINDSLGLESYKNEEQEAKLEELLEIYIWMNEYVILNNKIGLPKQ